MRTNPRRANGHRRDQVRRRVLAEENICGICGQPVDKTLKTPHPGSPEVDEIVPVSLGGDPFARANCRLAHRWLVQPAARQRHQSNADSCASHPVRDNTVVVDMRPWGRKLLEVRTALPRHSADPPVAYPLALGVVVRGFGEDAA